MGQAERLLRRPGWFAIRWWSLSRRPFLGSNSAGFFPCVELSPEPVLVGEPVVVAAAGEHQEGAAGELVVEGAGVFYGDYCVALGPQDEDRAAVVR